MRVDTISLTTVTIVSFFRASTQVIRILCYFVDSANNNFCEGAFWFECF